MKKFDRFDHLRSHLHKVNGNIIEIGPFFNPIFPKKAGFNTTTVDVLTKTELTKVAIGSLRLSEEQIKNIEEVDVIWKGSLFKTVGREHRYDVICSSHNFEHQPNPLSFLLEVEKLLAPEGVCTLAIPIASRCFDLFRNLSTTKDFLTAYRSNKVQADWLDIYDADSLKVKDSPIALHKHHKFEISELSTQDSLNLHSISQEELLRGAPSGYTDIHISILNPARFKFIMYELSRLGFLKSLKIFEIKEVGHEFFVHLSNDKPPISVYQLSRDQVLKDDLHYQSKELRNLCKKPNFLKSKFFFY